MADLLGYAASCAVLASFLMRTMIPLRLVAILSNILFLSFGYIQNIHPVLFLHLALLPINGFWPCGNLRASNWSKGPFSEDGCRISDREISRSSTVAPSPIRLARSFSYFSITC
jgi:hypothetical protein